MCIMWPMYRILLLRNLENTDPFEVFREEDICLEDIPGL